MRSVCSWLRLGVCAGAVSASLVAAQSTVVVDEAHALCKTWQAPEVPPHLAAVNGTVVVHLVVDATGAVTETTVASSTDERLNAPALASVRRWTFEPAIRDREPVASSLSVPIRFPLDHRARESLLPPIEPAPLPFTGPKVVRYGPTEEPEIVARRMLGGEVTLEFTVGADGRPADPRVLLANCAELIRPSIDALMRTEFSPARQGSLALPATSRAPFSFTLFGETRDQRLAANGIRLADGSDWSALDALPVPVAYADPVYPRDALLAGVGGEAEVAFTVTRAGIVENVVVVSSSAPDFGAALAAVLPLWSFTAAKVDGQGWVESRLLLKHTFQPPAPAADATQPEARLAALLGPGGPGIDTAKGLDQRLRPLFRIGVIPPTDLNEASASATIEFIIDREGRARLPRVREATSPSFGWAAATAVAQWLFERPTRDGRPVDVRVAIPVEFTR